MVLIPVLHKYGMELSWQKNIRNCRRYIDRYPHKVRMICIACEHQGFQMRISDSAMKDIERSATDHKDNKDTCYKKEEELIQRLKSDSRHQTKLRSCKIYVPAPIQNGNDRQKNENDQRGFDVSLAASTSQNRKSI